MKTQIENLVETLERQDKIKHDYIVPSTSMMFVDGKLTITKDKKPIIYTPSGIFHEQLATGLKIPKGYYDRMKKDAIKLLDSNVNTWLKSDEDKKKLIRTFEKGQDNNDARAFLSDRYNIIDNMEVLMTALDALKDSGLKIEIQAADLSETTMYLRVVCPENAIQGKALLKQYAAAIEKGYEIISGFIIKNSEVGRGKFSLIPRAHILACKNGMVIESDSLSKVHLGGELSELDMHKNSAIKNANRKLIKEQVKHAVSLFLSKDYLKKVVEKFTVMGDKKIDAPVANVIEVVSQEYGFSEDRKAGLLDFFIKGKDNRRIGVVNAITEQLQTIKDLDQQYDSEVIGYDLLTKFDRIEKAAFKTKFTAN